MFNLAGIIWGTKVILLTHNFAVRATVVGGPPQQELSVRCCSSS